MPAPAITPIAAVATPATAGAAPVQGAGASGDTASQSFGQLLRQTTAADEPAGGEELPGEGKTLPEERQSAAPEEEMEKPEAEGETLQGAVAAETAEQSAPLTRTVEMPLVADSTARQPVADTLQETPQTDARKTPGEAARSVRQTDVDLSVENRTQRDSALAARPAAEWSAGSGGAVAAGESALRGASPLQGSGGMTVQGGEATESSAPTEALTALRTAEGTRRMTTSAGGEASDLADPLAAEGDGSLPRPSGTTGGMMPQTSERSAAGQAESPALDSVRAVEAVAMATPGQVQGRASGSRAADARVTEGATMGSPRADSLSGLSATVKTADAPAAASTHGMATGLENEGGDPSASTSRGATESLGSGRTAEGTALNAQPSANAQAGAPRADTTAPAAGAMAGRTLDPQWGQMVGQRAVMMAQYGPRVAEIQLDPPELGALQIRIHVSHQDQVSVSFSSPQAAVRDALEQQIPRLREMFAEQGLELSQSSVSDQSSGEGGGDDSRGQGGGWGAPRYSMAESEEPLPSLQALEMGLVDDYA